MKCGFVIPVYRHGAALEAVIKNILSFSFPIIVVDDGNDLENKAYINQTAKKYSQVVLVTRQKNGGKGAAMRDGVKKASELGLTHILQLDSDGQHDSACCEKFWKLAYENPEAVICAYPVYDESVPKSRLNGRKIANSWIHFVTLSKEIKDGMIGFRVYPVQAYMRIIESHVYIDNRMGYDIDILVHLSWLGLNVISESVKVTYPSDGISNFRMVRDNLRIAGTYTRLCLGLFLRFSIILLRKIKRNNKNLK